MWATRPQKRTNTRAVLTNFSWTWLSPLVSIQKLAEGGDLTPEAAIANTQTALVLLGNASQYFATEWRKVLLQQLNPKLKALVEDSDFFDAPPLLFGTNFGKVAKDQLDALKKASTSSGWSSKQFFGRATPEKGLRANGAGGVAAATAPRTPREGGTTMLAPPQKGSTQQQPKDSSNTCRLCKPYCTSKPKNVICYQPYSDNYIPTRATEPVGHDHNMSLASSQAGSLRANWQVIMVRHSFQN